MGTLEFIRDSNTLIVPKDSLRDGAFYLFNLFASMAELKIRRFPELESFLFYSIFKIFMV